MIESDGGVVWVEQRRPGMNENLRVVINRETRRALVWR